MGGWLTKLLGNRGERLAARYLRRQGFKILSRQYSNRLGEIDLIARDGECLADRASSGRRREIESAAVQGESHVQSKDGKRCAFGVSFVIK